TDDRAVPSALEGLTSEFGMGSGVSPPVLPPLNRRRERESDCANLKAPVRLLRPTLACTPQAISLRREIMMVKPHGRLVPVSSTHCCASTPGLSPRGLQGAFSGPKPEGNLILRLASRLDAFSGYPFPT